MKKLIRRASAPRTFTATDLEQVRGGEDAKTTTTTTKTKTSTFELHFTCESVDFTNVK